MARYKRTSQQLCLASAQRTQSVPRSKLPVPRRTYATPSSIPHTQSRRVLISGAGIAGPVVAHWLGRAGIRSTLVERAPSLRTSGQMIDIRGVARKVIAKMGVESAIRARCTNEAGIYFVDERDRVRGTFPVDPEGGDSGACDIEILRYNLASVFYEASRATTEYVYGDSIKGIVEGEKEAVVEFESGRKEGYDVIVLADGMSSKARSLVFKSRKEGEPQGTDEFSYKGLGFYTAYFTLPYRKEDGRWSKWWTTTGSKSIWIRPDPEAETPSTRAYLITRNAEASRRLENYRSMDIGAQKKLWRELYQGAGWKTDRVLNGMDACPDGDFYMQEMAQVKMNRWHKGRVVLVGDAGSSPSPMSGHGTSCAITGAYVLGCELAKQADVTKAFEEYERICRPYIELKQDIPMWLFRFGWPEGRVGLGAVRTFATVFTAGMNTRLGKSLFGGEEDEKIELPNYDL